MPDPAQIQLNKLALLSALSPYGVTNQRLDQVSNFYRYNRSAGELWRHSPASAYATVVNGAVTGFVIVLAGAGYSSPPIVTIPRYPGTSAVASLDFTNHSASNGSINSIIISKSLGDSR